MSLLTRKRTILAKLESSYGVDPTPTGAANAILVRNLNVNPINAQLVQRDLIRPYLGNSDTLLAQVSVAMDFEIELAGAGASGSAPAWAPLLKACAFAEALNTVSVSITRSGAVATVTETAHGRAVGDSVPILGANETEYNGTHVVASVLGANTWTFAVTGTPTSPATGTITAGISAVYTPVSSAFPSLTLYYNVDGVLHKITGARGSFEASINVKQLPVLKFNFTGIYNSPSDTSAPTCDFSAFQIPKVANTQNTTAFSLMSYSGLLEQMTLNLGGDVQYRTLIGSESVLFVDRKPSGTFVLEAPTIAAKDFFTAAKDGTVGTMSITHGTVGGNKVKLDAARISLGNPNYQDSQGVQMLSIPFTAAPSSGNDEITITAF
jgi:hypothetical protein